MKEDRKRRAQEFRDAYNAEEGNIEVIPSKKDLGIDETHRKELVGPYCRVSTLAETQTESYELQCAYYRKYVERYPDWTLVDVYADEISGTSTKRRKNFNRLIDDCKNGKVTKILTKSIARFARNVVDSVSTVRMLRELPVPVGVLFETEQIDTMSRESDFLLSLLSSVAESESLNRSISMKWAIRKRFAGKIPKVCDTYGFDRYKKVLLSPVKPQCDIVAYMYDLLLDGLSPSLISRLLTDLRVPTPTGKRDWWSPASVAYILCNEKNCGDVIMQKTVTTDVFTHKAVRNIGLERTYIMRDHHPKIVTREDWEKAILLLGTYTIDTLFAFDAPVHFDALDMDFQTIDCSKGVFFS